MLRSILRNALPFLCAKIGGRSYSSYYAARMDRFVARKPDWGLDNPKTFQLEYCRKHGLSPGMRFLDYGCGALAAGRNFIDFLDHGRYTGADISPGVLALANRRLAEWGMDAKSPTLCHIRDFVAGDWLPAPQGPFDRIWAQSVFTHMPPADIARAMRFLLPLLAPDGVFMATYAAGDRIRHVDLKDWYYPPETIIEIARDAGFDATRCEDWHHPLDEKGTDHLLLMTRRP